VDKHVLPACAMFPLLIRRPIFIIQLQSHSGYWGLLCIDVPNGGVPPRTLILFDYGYDPYGIHFWDFFLPHMLYSTASCFMFAKKGVDFYVKCAPCPRGRNSGNHIRTHCMACYVSMEPRVHSRHFTTTSLRTVPYRMADRRFCGHAAAYRARE